MKFAPLEKDLSWRVWIKNRAAVHNFDCNPYDKC